MVAICALVVSVFSVGLTVWTSFLQRKHMRLSVRPIVSIPVADFEDRVGVFLQNKGLGPMRVVSLSVSDAVGKAYPDIKSHMPRLNAGVLWSNFHDSVDESTLEAGKRFELLLLQGDMNNKAYRTSRDRIRKKLSELKIEVEYEDLYGQRMEPHTDVLSFFGRHFSND